MIDPNTKHGTFRCPHVRWLNVLDVQPFVVGEHCEIQPKPENYDLRSSAYDVTHTTKFKRGFRVRYPVGTSQTK